MTIGEQLRAARIASGLGWRELAAAAGVSLSTWQRVEAGDVDPQVGTLRRMAAALGIEVVVELRKRRADGARRGGAG